MERYVLYKLIFSNVYIFLFNSITVLLAFISICTAVAAWQWLVDPETMQVSFLYSLYNHLFFTIASLLLGKRHTSFISARYFQLVNFFCFVFAVVLFVCGIHKRVVAPSIVACRARQVLTDFNMSCDDTGKLILKPRPSS